MGGSSLMNSALSPCSILLKPLGVFSSLCPHPQDPARLGTPRGPNRHLWDFPRRSPGSRQMWESVLVPRGLEQVIGDTVAAEQARQPAPAH